MCTGFWSFNFNIWRRRHVVKPSSPTRKVDLAETEASAKVGITRAESPVHMDVAVPATLTFPHPYEKVIRRYPLDAIRSTELGQPDDDAELQQQLFLTQPDQQRQQQHRQHSHGGQPTPAPHSRRVSIDAKSMRRHTTPLLISHRPPIDQLDLDLAYLSGDDVDDKSKVSKPFSSIRPLPKPPVPPTPLPLPPVQTSSTQPSSLFSSTSPPADHNHSTKKTHHHKNKHSVHENRNNATPSRRKRAATITTTTASAQTPLSSPSSSPPSSNFAKEKYYHRLPPSARYLADIARYPNCVDPIRPWNVLKDDRDAAADVKYTEDAKDATLSN